MVCLSLGQRTSWGAAETAAGGFVVVIVVADAAETEKIMVDAEPYR